MGQLQTINERLIELGYQIIAVSPDRAEKVREVLEKTSYDYLLLSDTKLSAARALGVAFQVDAKTFERYRGYGIDLEDASGETHHLLPVPSVFVLDRAGEIRFVHSDPNYKVRIEPDVLVAEAEKALR